MSLPSPHLGLVLAPRAGRQPGLTARHIRCPLADLPPEGLFRFRDELHDRHPNRPDHPARRVRPPARRTARRRSCSSRSSRDGSAGTRSSAAARGSSRSRRRRPQTRRSSASSATTTPPTLEPTVPLPADGPDLPESRFVVADTLVRFDHAAGLARGALRRPRRAARAARRADRRELPRGAGTPRADPALPRPLRVRARRARGEGAHPRRRRLPDRALPARRAPDLGERARALPHPPPRQSVAVPLPARARRRSR